MIRGEQLRDDMELAAGDNLPTASPTPGEENLGGDGLGLWIHWEEPTAISNQSFVPEFAHKTC